MQQTTDTRDLVKRFLATPADVLRLVLATLGTIAMASAFGLWLVPAASGAPALSLMRLGVSLFMLLTGLCCLSLARSWRR